MSSHLKNIEGTVMEGKTSPEALVGVPLEVVSPYEPAGDQPQEKSQPGQVHPNGVFCVCAINPFSGCSSSVTIPA